MADCPCPYHPFGCFGHPTGCECNNPKRRDNPKKSKGRSITRDEYLILLIEECGEVIQAATKCLRFGFDRKWPDYGVNREVLAGELGDLLGAADALGLDQDIIERHRADKIKRAQRWKEYAASHPAEIA